MLTQILNKAKDKISALLTMTDLEAVRIEFMGKSGLIAQQMKLLGSMEAEERKIFGESVNKIKAEFEELLAAKKSELKAIEMNAKLAQEKIDISLPARTHKSGSLHPIMQAMEELTQILAQMGFEVKEGPSIETQYYNFSALNIDENHPARQTCDTFYIGNKEDPMVLRTHTSSVQIRTMEKMQPPLKFIAPGRTYRSEYDQTHSPMFHQIEFLEVNEKATMKDLKYVIENLLVSFFEGQAPEVRLRPSFFPFTTPSTEVDVRFKGGDWLEVLGCGMVHPQVLRNCGLDPEKYQGYAVGLGVERFAMLKYGITDLRQFYEGDSRWLEHYNFSAFDIPSIIGGLTR